MKTCKTCHWYLNGDLPGTDRTCRCPKMIYGYSLSKAPVGNTVKIEDDEGWGMIPGPDFGCIHHKDK